METSAKTKWGIDPMHSEISFKVKHLMITNVKGVFREFDASIYTTADNFITADINLHLKTESIDTGSTDRDTHLRSADFFDVENHPEMIFKGSSVEKADDNSYTLTGDLTIKDITKEIKLDVEFNGVMKDALGNEKAGYAINGKINRKNWDLNWNAALEAGGLLVSDDVKISCEIQLIKQS